MFWIALSAQAAAPPPPPEHLPGLVAATDYPPGAMDRGEQGSVYVQILVSPLGRVDNCTILLSSGYRDLDNATCLLVTSRARFSPARDDDGKPEYGTFRGSFHWRIAGMPAPRQADIPPDLDLTINQTPEGVKLPLQFKVEFHVSADGTRSHCQMSAVSKPVPQVLTDLACRAAMQLPVHVIRNHNNEPVEASDNATVRFNKDKDKS